MPLFKHSEPAPVVTTTRTSSTTSGGSRGLFGSRKNRTDSPVSPVTSHSNSTSTRGSGLFHRNEDPSISGARQRVAAAESAEREADRALITARESVREAREHVKLLEREAAEE